MTAEQEKKLAVVLSGGGAKGAYEAGALQIIAQEAAKIHILTGASIGAINAAAFAVEYERSRDLVKAAAYVRQAWLEIEPLFQLSIWYVLRQMIHARFTKGSFRNIPAITANEQIIATINQYLPDIRISELTAIDLHINATNLNTGKTETFNRKHDASLREAVLASSCIPLLFATRQYNQSYYIDGGLFNNTPLRDAIVAGATDIIVVELKPADTQCYLETIQDDRGYESAWHVGARLMELVLDTIMYEDVKHARQLNKIIAVIRRLESLGDDSPALQQLKDAIRYERNGRVKKEINICEIAPNDRLEPPGTLGFHNRQAILDIMKQGEADAKEQLVKQQWFS